MLDYYGSILKSSKDIDLELLNNYKNKYNEEYIKKIIANLRKEKIIEDYYSVSGWLVFHKTDITIAITEIIINQKQKNEKKLKAVYCLEILFLENNIKDNDIIKYILDI